MVGSSITKNCPECDAETGIKTVVCECGHWFFRELEVQQSTELQEMRWKSRSEKLKNLSVFGGFAILLLCVPAYWGGFFGGLTYNSSESSDQTVLEAPAKPAQTATSDDILPGNVQFTVATVLTGDRFVVLDANSRERRIRIYGTSAPKLDQDLGIESKENLAKLILGKNVLVQTRRTEPGGEILGDVMIDGRNVGLDQLRAGLVRLVEEEVLELNAEQQRVFAEADNAAKNAAIGLWARSADGTPLINSTASSYNAPLQAFRTSGPAAQAATGADAAETAPAGETVEVTEMPVQKPVTESQPGAPTPAPVESVVVPPQDTVKPADSRAAASTPPAAKAGPKVYTRGPRGGCFFISASGNKTYVDRSLCN